MASFPDMSGAGRARSRGLSDKAAGNEGPRRYDRSRTILPAQLEPAEPGFFYGWTREGDGWENDAGVFLQRLSRGAPSV